MTVSNVIKSGSKMINKLLTKQCKNKVENSQKREPSPPPLLISTPDKCTIFSVQTFC